MEASLDGLTHHYLTVAVKLLLCPRQPHQSRYSVIRLGRTEPVRTLLRLWYACSIADRVNFSYRGHRRVVEGIVKRIVENRVLGSKRRAEYVSYKQQYEAKREAFARVHWTIFNSIDPPMKL